MKQRQIEFEVEGLVEILFNRFTEQAQENLEKGSQGKPRTKQGRIDEAYTKVYRNKKGQLCVPAGNIKKTLLNGCRMAKIKYGRGSAEPYMRAVVFLDETMLPIYRSNGNGGRDIYTEPDDIHEVAGRIPPGPKGKMAIIRRPYCKEGWRVSGIFNIFDDRVSDDMIKQSLEESGLLVGLCDHRPEYGRFKVISFKSKT